MEKKYIVSLDQGTTSSRAVLFDKNASVVGFAQKEFHQIYPKPGYVEQDPMEIYSSELSVLYEVLSKNSVSPEEVAAIGITNQRETTILWDKISGKPIYNAIVWQCRRTAEICEDLKRRGLSEKIRQKTGLIPDAYFSATKIKWILDNVPGARERAVRGEILFGTVDSWLLWNLTNGKVHVTDCTNASRTMLFNIHTLTWDEELLKELSIPGEILPEVKSSSEIYGTFNLSGREIPISGIAGDQQAALFGQRCFYKGGTKNTYGTGCFLLTNTGERAVYSKNNLLTTIAYKIGDTVNYALEGSIFVGGAVIQWLRDELKLIEKASDSEAAALSVPDNGGVYIVPAFVGLGAPYWDMYARGGILGLTRGANKKHLIRAALESIAYQTKDVLDAVISDTGICLPALNVDGGASENKFLMKFQSDILEIPVKLPKTKETTALGAAYLAGLSVGFFESMEALLKEESFKTILPEMGQQKREKLLKGWKKAVSRVRLWTQDSEE